MKIKLTMLLEKLTDIPYQYFPAEDNAEKAFSSIRLLQTVQQEYRSDVLYLATADMLNRLESKEWPYVVICAETEEAPLVCDAVGELALIRHANDILALKEKLENIIADYTDLYNAMIRMVIDNQGLKEIINEMTSFLGNPFYVADSDFRVIARSSCPLNKPDQWIFIIENGIEDGYISSSVNDFYYMKDLMKKTENQNKPVFFAGNALYPHSFCSMNLQSQNHKIGLMTVFETEKEFSIGTKALFDFFSEIIVLELLKNRTINENEGIKLGYLFSEILTGNQSSENELSKIIQFMELDFPRSFYILTIKSRSEERNRYELTFLRKRMIQMLSHTVCIIFQNAIVFLTDQKNDCCWLRPESQFLNWLNDKRMVAGVSEIYHDAGAIKKAYHQTLKAIDLGLKTKETIYSYQQFRFSDLLQQIGNLNEWESLVHPALEKIKAYDAEKNSDLEETLYTYMKSGRSQAQTAKILHVHRSSLQYRLSKIESVMGISLDDYQTFLHLQLSIEVEKNSVLKTI